MTSLIAPPSLKSNEWKMHFGGFNTGLDENPPEKMPRQLVVRRTKNNLWVGICPNCGEKHRHGISSLLWRSAHCGNFPIRFEKTLPDYEIVEGRGIENCHEIEKLIRLNDKKIRTAARKNGYHHIGTWHEAFTKEVEVEGEFRFSSQPIHDANGEFAGVKIRRYEQTAGGDNIFPPHSLILRINGKHDAYPAPKPMSEDEYIDTVDRARSIFSTSSWAIAQNSVCSESEFIAAREEMERVVSRLLAGVDSWPDTLNSATTTPQLSPIPAIAAPLTASPAPTLSDRRYPLRTADDLATEPPAPYRVKNIFPRYAIAAIYGPSGGGKSFVGIDLVVSISDGNNWFGYRVEPCDVLYIALEGQSGISQRVKAVREKRGLEAGKRVKFLTAPFSLLFSDDLTALIETVKDAGICDGVIVLDTLNAATPGMDENSSSDMGKAIAATKRIREECGGLVILIHHSGKDASKGLRGHSSLHAALDTVIEVTRDGDRRCWKMSKAKDGADGEEHQFRLEVLEVGIDEDGDPITSCVVVPEENPVDAVRRVKVPAGGNQRIVWDAVNELLRDSRAFGLGNAPPTRPCIELEAAIEKISPRLATDPKRRNERVRSAITGLVNRGLLRLDGGFLWLP